MNKMRLQPLVSLVFCLMTCVTAPYLTAGDAAPASRPNVIVILADDLGWGDVSCYHAASKVRTQSIDALAATGMRMLNAYTPASVCSPTRYGLLTGRYPWRTWHREGVLYEYDPSLIRPGRMTLGSLHQQLGYATAVFGKWHVGLDWQPLPGDPGDWTTGQPVRYADRAKIAARIDFTRPIQFGPRDLGFDRFFGTVHQGIDTHVVRDRLRVPDLVTRPQDHDDLFVDESLQFIADCRSRQPATPFFIYLALGSPHHGRDAPDRWKGKSADGIRGDRILWADASVGRILDAIDEQGIADDTLVIFTSDNGASDNRRSPAGNPEHHPNGPYRGFKTDAWDGGYRVPFIVRWPGKVVRGSSANQMICLTDVLATLAAVGGVSLPEWGGEDSYSMLHAWTGSTAPVRDHVLLQSYTGVMSIREGSWKLILGTEGSGGGQLHTPGWMPNQAGWDRIGTITIGQLYDLETDPCEQTNIFAERPDVVARLRGTMEEVMMAQRSPPLAHAGFRKEPPADETEAVEKAHHKP